ncbi:MAG: hypothetical protein OJF52_003901 [Nitrospira sp.]|jgi:hypothetical protein|nr:MAG: hypothetical protein OJF52_003901 [Nitrospira sp.]
MAHSLTEMNIKQPILDLVKREFGSMLESPGSGIPPQEFPLKALKTTFKADFAYRIKQGGWLFIEDDSHGTCLSNLLKYAAWISETKPEMPIYLIHIIAPKDSGWVRLCRLEGERLNRTIINFTHIVISTPDWPEQNPKWLDFLRQEINKINRFGSTKR